MRTSKGRVEFNRWTPSMENGSSLVRLTIDFRIFAPVTEGEPKLVKAKKQPDDGERPVAGTNSTPIPTNPDGLSEKGHFSQFGNGGKIDAQAKDRLALPKDYRPMPPK